MIHAPNEKLPVAVIGAGPVGLAAAAYLAERNLPFVVFEAGQGPAASMSQWGHVTFFSPWQFDVDAAAERLLNADDHHPRVLEGGLQRALRTRGRRSAGGCVEHPPRI